MTTFTFLQHSYQRYLDKYSDTEEGAAPYFQIYKKKIADDRQLNDLDHLNIDNFSSKLEYQLIIAEDDLNTLTDILEFIKSAPECHFLENVLLCDDQSTLELLLNTVSSPVILIMDYYFLGSNKDNHSQLDQSIRTYIKVKSAWPSTKVIGLSHFAFSDESKKLRELMQSNDDDVFNKKILSDALPSILLNCYQNSKLKMLSAYLFQNKANTLVRTKQECANELSAILLHNMDGKTARIEGKVLTILRLQEQVLAFTKDRGLQISAEGLAVCILLLEHYKKLVLTEVIIIRAKKKDLNEDFLKTLPGKMIKFPIQPRARVQKHFKLFEHDGVLSKNALNLYKLFKEEPERFPVTYELSISRYANREISSPQTITFVDGIIELIYREVYNVI